MVKVLVAVMACEAHLEFQQASRDTWASEVESKGLGDMRFFLGHGTRPLFPDEIRLDVPDDLASLILKVQEICNWALQRSYDMILKLDTDTYVNVQEMAKAVQGYHRDGIDYIGAPVGQIGHRYAGTNAFSFIQGSGSWLSAKAARLVQTSLARTFQEKQGELMKYNGLISPYAHSEDLWVGQLLTPHIHTGHIKCLADSNYTRGPLTFHSALAYIKNTPGMTAKFMNDLHAVRPNGDQMIEILRSYKRTYSEASAELERRIVASRRGVETRPA